MSPSVAVGIGALAALQGLLVALPRADALHSLSRVRSPAWTLLLPGTILVGTFGPLVAPSLATALILLAIVLAPLLVMVAVFAVIRGPRVVLAVAATLLLVLTLVLTGWAGQISASTVTALGCLTLGVALARLIPSHWLIVGVLGMSLLDVVLLGSGVGETASATMNAAASQFHGPSLDGSTIGPVTLDYPDLVLTAMLGASVAGDARAQPRVALLLTGLVTIYGILLPPIGVLPATLPTATTFVLLRCRRRWRVAGAAAAAAAPAAGRAAAVMAPSAATAAAAAAKPSPQHTG